jgi:hypothetical protein
MDDAIVNEIINRNNLIPVLAISLGCLIAIISIVSCTIRGIMVSRAKEQTKRELAAYVAEGSLDPDKAVAMINAGRPHWEAGTDGKKSSCCG